ncbi:hypothetical protein [Hydrocarboniclastica marina]|nr:hypothetical protein [Hydrocarboniclastica marina]
MPMIEQGSASTESPETSSILARFNDALTHLGQARSFAKGNHIGRVLDLGRKLLTASGGPALLYSLAREFDGAGIFEGSDWEKPENLKAKFVPHTFNEGDARLVTLECLSELRMLAVANGQYFHPGLSSEQAKHFLTQVLAFNLQVLFGASDESTRNRPATIQKMLEQHLAFIAEHIGLENILDQVVDEVWRILRQRPIQVDNVREMITRIAACLFDPDIQVQGTARGAERLISALFGPTHGCREDPGVEVYLQRLDSMDIYALEQEAQGFARAMHDTGLVSAYHAAYLRRMADEDTEYIAKALGLSTTGRDCLFCYRDLVLTLIRESIYLETCQAIYGLAQFLERGLLYQTSIPNGLWRAIQTPLHPDVQAQISALFGSNIPPRAHTLSALLSVLGQPLGLGQGNNPACQSTRALSLWSYTNPDYLLQIFHWALRDNSLTMHFEGEAINSAELGAGVVQSWNFDLDTLSLVLVPHLDRIYMEMGRRAGTRGEDPHRWINPEFHGWWVHRGFAIAVDIHTQKLDELEHFISTFYTVYNPLHNGNTPVVHPQPAGIAVTDSDARFVGWHAISILRVAVDQEDVIRVYFFNPNNDSGQDWGNGVIVSTDGYGEQQGESSLPIDQFTSRLYLFHYDVREFEILAPSMPEEELQRVKSLVTGSWGKGRE